MSDQEHTPGAWLDDERGFGVITDQRGYVVATANRPQDSRRIVACVNACDGISTENLEDNLPVKELALRYNEIIKQRDSLLTALAQIANDVRNLGSARIIAKVAIANVEGSAA
jgi:hypothetical protein